MYLKISLSGAWLALLFLISPAFGQNQYWQQRADYQIVASLDDHSDQISAEALLTYYNYSPHTLDRLYFHLYANAFQPESYYHHLYRANHSPVRFGSNEAAGLGTLIDGLRVNGDSVQYTIDNTIMEVRLNQPLQSGDSLQVKIHFRTWFDDGGTMRRRQKMFRQYGVKHYNAVHWYPVVCVYDRYGWHTPQHLDKEYYAEFGNFDVQLTLPQQYIVGATGLLINEEEVLPAALKKRLQLSNFKSKPLYEKPSVIIPEEKGKTKTWHFVAGGVHNFAFTADPTYRISEVILRGTKIQVLAREPHAARWQEIPGIVALMMRLYSEQFGAYEYPSLVVADAQDGTEYGMMAIVNGFYPGNIGLIAHELAHQWFYGMLANNETYRAYMDEGFAEFLTVWMLEKLYGGKEVPQSVKSKAVTRHLQPYNFGYARLLYPYLDAVHQGFDKPLNTHSNDFSGGIGQTGGYGLTYSKGGTMLMQLRYVLGDELFYKAIADYVQRWKFKHPYPEDFRQSVIATTGQNLNWFFDQWLETTKTTDYAVTGLRKGRKSGEYQLELTRKGEMQMPLDISITLRNGEIKNFHIPNEWFQKTTQASILPKWTGWGSVLNRRYTAIVQLDAPPVRVEIDTSQTLADTDRSNNIRQFKIPPIQWEHKVKNLPYWRGWQYFWHPDPWYNNYDGLQIGARLSGDYFGGRKNWLVALWWNTGLLQNNIPEGLEPFHRKWSAQVKISGYYLPLLSQWQQHINAKWNAGVYRHQIGLSRVIRRRDQYNPNYYLLEINQLLFYRPSDTDRNYLHFPAFWRTGVANSTMNTSLTRFYQKSKSNGQAKLLLRHPFWVTADNYGYLEGEWKHTITGKKSDLRMRYYARFTQGSLLHFESDLYAAGANPEQLLGNRFTESAIFSPLFFITEDSEWNRLHMAGGLNIRGFAPQSFGSLQRSFIGRHGISTNWEWDFSKLIAIRSRKLKQYIKISSYLFADGGLLYSRRNQAEWLADAGVGAYAEINLGGENRTYKPLVLRVDVPVWANRPLEGRYVNLNRFIFGIGRSL
jgi:aminopeptidase N